MSIFQMISPSIHTLSSTNFISGEPLFLTTKLTNLSLTSTTTPPPLKTTIIRMGGGPRTFPGGVSKWQWKRMQAKKSKQLLKARLARERQIYEMRKRAELKSALSELERPWEVVEKAPTLFSVKADEQLKVLADRFQKPGGFDMWSEEDGPELFKNDGGFPSARFFPKGVVHSVKPYGKIENNERGGEGLVRGSRGDDGLINWRSVLGGGGSDSNLRAKGEGGSGEMAGDQGNDRRLRNNVFKKRRERRSRDLGGLEGSSRGVAMDEGNGRRSLGQVYNKRDSRMLSSSQDRKESAKAEVYELRLERDGRYEFLPENLDDSALANEDDYVL